MLYQRLRGAAPVGVPLKHQEPYGGLVWELWAVYGVPEQLWDGFGQHWAAR